MSTTPWSRTKDVSQTDTDSPATQQAGESTDTPAIDAVENPPAAEVEHRFVRNPDASTQRKTVIECDGSCGIPDCEEMRVVPETW